MVLIYNFDEEMIIGWTLDKGKIGTKIMWMSFFSFQIYSRDNVWIYGDRNALRWD